MEAQKSIESGYYQSPTIHQETIVFVCEDDLWTVPTEGGIARRLTSGLAEASAPALSPDGQLLAFTSREEGDSEVYVMPARGGKAERLTYLGVTSTVIGWTAAAEIIFASNTAQAFSAVTELYTISPEGGQPEKLPLGHAVSVSYGSEGGVVIGRNATDLARWKRYRGGLTGDLWISSPDDEANWRRLIKLEGNIANPMWLGERVYFVSDHEGIGNLYSCLPDGTDLQRHTDHSDYYVRNPKTDGERIVYHAGADLHLFTVSTGQSQPITVEFYSPRVQRNRKFVDADSYFQGYDLHPKGHSLAISSRGKPFVFGNWEGAVTQLGELNGVRYRLATWLCTGEHLAVVTDASGEERLEVHATDGSHAETLSDLDVGRPMGLLASPQLPQLALTNHRNQLVFIDLLQEEPTAQVLDESPYGRIRGFSWSPDGRWLAYGYTETSRTTAIRLCNVNTGEIHTVTEPILHDVNPVFSPDGKHLYFLSYRHFDLVRDSLQFGYAFPWGMKPYLITLRADLPSPFEHKPHAPGDKPPQDPPPTSADTEDTEDTEDTDEDSADETNGDGDADGGDGDADSLALNAEINSLEGGGDEALDDDDDDADADDDEGDDEDDAESIDDETDSAGGQNNAPPAMQIDFEGISQRILPFPVGVGLYGQIRGIKGKVLFTSFPLHNALNKSYSNVPSARGTLRMFKFEDLSRETIASGITNFDVSMDGKTLVYRSGNAVRVLKAGDKPSGGGVGRKGGWVSLNRVKVSVEPELEWQQMFREAWRLQRDHFWTEDMSGVDWQKIYERYWPLIQRVGTRSEFSDLMWEMQGELATSHAYESGGDYRPEPNYFQGFLGADLRYDAEKEAYQITHIVQGDVWDSRLSSPLARAGVNLKVGDWILTVNGRPVSETLSPEMILVNQANQRVSLTVQSGGDESAKPRTVTVKALLTEFGPRYRDWVAANRQRVHEASEGRLGYLHIPDMGAGGFAAFHRGYLAEVGREGLIVDVRYNRGGSVSSLLLERLARRRLGYDVPRWGQPQPYPPESVAGPIVALCNQNSASDGDMFSHAFKLMGLGPLIGTRTWGGVIGIWPRNPLVDGGYTTQPEFSFWFKDVGWQVENFGTEPDIEVEISPQDFVEGRDPQLERAISEAMQSLQDSPPEKPDFSNRPRLDLPTLPER